LLYVPDRKCAFIPDDLNFEKIISGTLTTPAGFTTPFPLPAWPDTFGPVEYTHNLMLGYAVLSVLWAVTSLIIIGKWRGDDAMKPTEQRHPDVHLGTVP
jgi:hypothetical protein